MINSVVVLNDTPFDTYQYANWLRGADLHFYFIQAAQAASVSLYLPAVVSFLNGFEATLRVTLKQLDSPMSFEEPSPYNCLSNTLILNARDAGLNVNKLALPGEHDFVEKLESKKPSIRMVELVRIRNNLCHGNVFDFINKELGEDNMFFTPECLRQLSTDLFGISLSWCESVSDFREQNLGL